MPDRLAEADRIAADIVASEPFMWLMVGSHHTEAQLEALRPAYKAWRDAKASEERDGPTTRPAPPDNAHSDGCVAGQRGFGTQRHNRPERDSPIE